MDPLLKLHGFTRAGVTWRKNQGESIAVLNVQKSRWGDGTFFVNVGTYFMALGREPSPPANRCHVQLRLEGGDPEAVVTGAIQWFQARATFKGAALLAESDSACGLVFKELRHAVAT